MMNQLDKFIKDPFTPTFEADKHSRDFVFLHHFPGPRGPQGMAKSSGHTEHISLCFRSGRAGLVGQSAGLVSPSTYRCGIGLLVGVSEDPGAHLEDDRPKVLKHAKG